MDRSRRRLSWCGQDHSSVGGSAGVGARGLRSALILNDQGEALVDAEFSDLHGFPKRRSDRRMFLLQVF